jgi:hypothetical protein
MRAIFRPLTPFLFSCAVSLAQSTFGVVIGTVQDPAGAMVKGAAVKLTNVGENTSRETLTAEDGTYEFQNVKPAGYTITVNQAGFRAFRATELVLVARQTLRVDASLQLGDTAETVNVEATAGVIATDSAAISEALSSAKVVGLPSNLRAGGNTTPYNLIAILPGVQPDNGNAFSIQGGLPAQQETSVDGISITNVTGNSPNRNLFPSVESIAEIRVQCVGNAAEYGAPGDITTTSKSGTNQMHGAGFWYHQNRALDARSFGQTVLPAKIGNTFGGTLGGPVWIPHVYSGKNRTFFYFTWESFRFPRQTTIQNSVPTQAMRDGDFTQEGVTVRDPFTGTPFPGNRIPASSFNNVAKAVIPFYPLPNVGAGLKSSSANYIDNRSAKVTSDQYDVRIDHQINAKHAIFGRYTQKWNPANSPNSLLLPSDTGYTDHQQAVVSYTATVRPNLLNEFRGGISYAPSGATFPFDGLKFTNSLNLQDIQRDIFFNALPDFAISNLTAFAKGRPGQGASWNTQFLDNVTWIHGKHTVKAGFDIRSLRAQTNLGFTTGDNYGDYNFTGNFSGAPWADFLLGVPASTQIAVVVSDNDGRATHYKAFVQDSFRATQKLTVDIGLRWEFQPGYHDAGLNIANFDRTVPRTGQVIIPSDPAALKLVAPATLLAVNACPAASVNGIGCTPFVTAADAGLPEGLRRNYTKQFLPRLGLAYRLDNKTTIRGNFGVYDMILLGSVFFSLTGTVQSDVRSFNNVGSDGKPIFVLPQTRTPDSGIRAGALGTFQFRTANQIDFHPPYMLQWGLSIDRQLNSSMGLRLSYIANRGVQLPWAPDLNQPQSSTTFYSQRPATDRPFPFWDLIYSRDSGANSIYNSLQVELNRRFSSGLSFSTAYTLAKNLADNVGPNPSSFAGETGGGRVTNSLDRRADRGDVYATRRHRSVTTLIYELPVGRKRRLFSSMSRPVDAVVGGWSISSIVTLQSGPYLTPTMSVGDPSGTNAPNRGTQRPDRVASGSLSNPTANLWLDRSAFVCPGQTVGANQFNCNIGVVPGRDPAPLGRFGNSGVGIIEGPGSFSWNAGMLKRFAITEKLGLKLEGTFTNVTNHVNLGDPQLSITNNSFGKITSARSGEFGAGRTGQVSMRIEF